MTVLKVGQTTPAEPFLALSGAEIPTHLWFPHFALPSEVFAFSTAAVAVQLVMPSNPSGSFFLLIHYFTNDSSPGMCAIYSYLKPVLGTHPYWAASPFLQLSPPPAMSMLNPWLPTSPPLDTPCPRSPIPKGFTKTPLGTRCLPPQRGDTKGNSSWWAAFSMASRAGGARPCQKPHRAKIYDIHCLSTRLIALS